jgi:hypothetical protein
MEIKLQIKEVKDELVLFNSEAEIETYCLTKTIDFSKLMNFLLKDELKNTFLIDQVPENTNSQQEKLISLIKEILKEYGSRVSAYNEFVKNSK